MKRLFLLLAISILSIVFISSIYAQSVPITDISTEGTFEPYVWKKFRGEPITLFNFPYMLIAPDIIDWSYAGYKNGNEPIPDGSGLPVYRVADYGGIANDGLSDTQAIRDTIDAVKDAGGNSIILFAPGRYDIYMDDDNKDNFTITGSNIIIRGAGGAGADKGGTTIKMHNHVKTEHHIFKVSWKGNGKNSGDAGLTRIVGQFPKGVKRFQVANGSALSGRKYLEIYGPGLKGADWAKHSSKTASQLPGASGVKTAGISIWEIHEIDHLDGNWVIIKAPTLTHLNSNFQVYWRELTEGLGFEDLHIEGTLNENYEHRVHRGSGGISLKYTAHCWVKRCRFSNVIDSVWFGNSYANTALANITDGNGGHNPLTAITSTYSLFGLYEDRTSNGIVHGVTVANASSGTVFYRIGGPLFGGPDTHGGQPRDTLIDNLYGRYHDGSGGTPASKPSHLDGYVRWNNTSRYHETYDLWQPEKEHGLMITEAIIIGWVAPNSSGIRNAYTESVGTHVYPESLYEAQGIKRLGMLPAMVTEGIEDFKYLFNTSYGTGGGRVERPAHIYDPPQMTPVRNRTPQVRDAIMVSFPGKDYDEVGPDDLADLNTDLELSNKGITALKSSDFDGLTALRHLQLGNNELTTLPDGIFDGLSTLTNLYLNDNEFETLPKLAFRRLDSLAILYLQNNKLTTLSETQFIASSVLKNINLRDNEIETIHEDAFAVLPGLTGLDLTGNNLATLPEGVFEHTPKLKYLTLKGNKFTKLPKGIFKGLSELLRLDVSGNPTDPLPITVTLRDWQGYLEAYIPVCSPFDFEVKISIENGVVGSNTLTFLTSGEFSSGPTQISRNSNEAVTVDIINLPSLPKHHTGYELVKHSELPLIVLPAVGNAPKAIPNLTRVLPNFPNPFNPETWIPYQLAKPANVSITIFNSRGVVVRELLLGIKSAGFYSNKANAAHWDGRNRIGEYVSSGMYFYQFKTGNKSVIQKMVIMK